MSKSTALVVQDTPSTEWSVCVDGYDGPFDALLALARVNKIDLRTVCLAELTKAYIDFLQNLHALRPDIASAHAVSAAWLVYLKSRLLLPADPVQDEIDGMSAQEAAARLQAHLLLLEKFRDLAEKLYNRPQLGRDFFARGFLEAVEIETTIRYDASLYALMMSYGRHKKQPYTQPLLIGLQESKLINSVQGQAYLTSKLSTLLQEWTCMQHIVPPLPRHATAAVKSSAVVSCLSACLEAAKSGIISLRQHQPFGDIEVKAVETIIM